MPRMVAAPRPGRPKDAAKHAAILAAARELFSHHPFEGVTMDAVAAAAGVSKMTAYSHFDDKVALFEAVVRSTTDGLMIPDEGSAELDIGERLVAIGRRFLTLVLDPGTVARRHMLAASLRGNRALAARFYEAGPGRTLANLAAVLAAASAAGELDVADPAAAAEDLVSLWQGHQPVCLTLGVIESVPPEQIEQRAQHGTDVFLRAFARRG